MAECRWHLKGPCHRERVSSRQGGHLLQPLHPSLHLSSLSASLCTGGTGKVCPPELEGTRCNFFQTTKEMVKCWFAFFPQRILEWNPSRGKKSWSAYGFKPVSWRKEILPPTTNSISLLSLLSTKLLCFSKPVGLNSDFIYNIVNEE